MGGKSVKEEKKEKVEREKRKVWGFGKRKGNGKRSPT